MWTKTIDAVASELGTDIKQGLSSKEAKKRLNKNGPNKIKQKNKKPIWLVILKNFYEPFPIILLLLTVISFSIQHWNEGSVVLIIVLIDAIISSVQEIKAEKYLDSLRNLISPKATVIRDNRKISIPAQDLVVGDLVQLEAGVFVPADLRLIETYNLKINESALTGESDLVEKDAWLEFHIDTAIGDRKNITYMSTIVTSGSGIGIVISTADCTEIGKISLLINEEKPKPSPLNRQILLLIRLISIVAFILGIIMFLFKFLLNKASIIESIIFGIAVLIAVIPEALPVIVTVFLALTTIKLAKKKTIIKNLDAIETLGQISVICSDKTGTLTKNQMTIVKIYCNEKMDTPETFIDDNVITSRFLDCLILCNDSFFQNNKVFGDPTEIAGLYLARDLDIDVQILRGKFERIYHLPFDSDRKLMSTFNHSDGDDNILYVKGAPDNLLQRCNKLFVNDKIIDLTATQKAYFLKINKNMNDESLRVLGLAYKPLDLTTEEIDALDDPNVLENELIFLGFIGLKDPIKNEVKKSLHAIKQAGIKMVMITGDHLDTALAIAKELNIITHKEQGISGTDLDALESNYFQNNIENYRVFARVSPEHKLKIVKALQYNGNIVAMTGDGVNDAPSLKAADIGIAMGNTGTDVAKDAAQMILMDDDFTTINTTIEEGRNIFWKLRNIISFLLVTNFSQVLTLLFAAIFNSGDLLKPLQILWINLIVDSFLGIPLALGPLEKKLMEQKPINKNVFILTKAWPFIIVNSIALALLLISTTFWLPPFLAWLSIPFNNNYIFLIMVNAPMIYALCFSTGITNSTFSKSFFKNKYLWYAILFIFTINTLIVFLPFLQNLFELEKIDFRLWIICLVIACAAIFIFEIYKLIVKSVLKIMKKSY